MHPQEKKKPIGLYPCICFWRATNVATTNKNRSLKRNRYFTKGDISLSKLHLALYTMLRTGQYHVTNEEPAQYGITKRSVTYHESKNILIRSHNHAATMIFLSEETRSTDSTKEESITDEWRKKSMRVSHDKHGRHN